MHGTATSSKVVARYAAVVFVITSHMSHVFSGAGHMELFVSRRCYIETE